MDTLSSVAKRCLAAIGRRYKSNPATAIAYCEEILVNKAVRLDELVAVDEFCLYLLNTDPVRAINVTKLRLATSAELIPGMAWSILAAAYSQIGDSQRSIETCRKGLEADMPLRMRINIISTLSKYDDVSNFVSDLVARYDPKSDGIDMASRIFQLANRYAFWKEAYIFSRQMEEFYKKRKYGLPSENARLNLLWCSDQHTNVEVVSAMIHRQYGPLTKIKNKGHAQTRAKKSRLTIGYLSADFRDHPTSHLMMGAWRNHNRKKFSIVFFDNGWDDRSPTRLELSKYCDELVPVAKLSDDEAAATIKSKKVDILIELNGPTHSNRLGILRFHPALLQVGYLGWPGSYGGGLVDAIIADRYVLPPSQDAIIPEKIIRMPTTYQVNDHATYPIFQGVLGKKKVHSPFKENFKFGSTNNVNKLNLDVWDVWMHILRNAPYSELHILHPGLPAIKNLINYAGDFGIQADRIKWLPRLDRFEHLSRLSQLDLILDPWPYGGHTTTTDALAAGVPVLTKEGANFAGRVAGSLLTAAGLGKALIAKDSSEYAAKAIAFANSQIHLDQISLFMEKNLPKAKLFNSKQWTEDFEKALLDAYNGL